MDTDGSTLVVGYWYGDGPVKSSGIANVFERSGAGWRLVARLHPQSGVANQNFGSAVAVDGDVMAIASAGLQYLHVFERNAGAWTETARLRASDFGSQREFGDSLDVEGGQIVVGSPANFVNDPGAVYVFRKSGGSWVQAVKIAPPAAPSGVNQGFGRSVSLSGSTLAVGAPEYRVAIGNTPGATYVYTGSFSTWSLQAKIVSSGLGSYPRFGRHVALDEDRLVAGTGAEAAVVYHRVGASWTQTVQLTGETGGGGFGQWVALDSEVVAVARPGDLSVELFDATTGSWGRLARLRATSGFGFADGVSLDSGTLVVGDWHRSVAVYGLDVDNDRLTAGQERALGTSPIGFDTDGDGLGDGDEALIHLSSPLLVDTDGDDLTDGEEVLVYRTSPIRADTDADRLMDSAELRIHRTDPLKVDTDADRLGDGAEVLDHLTDPLDPDTDGEGLLDGEEVLDHRTDPLKRDTDADRLTDFEEVRIHKTLPLKPDTDADRLRDGDEVYDHKTSPLNPDTDGEGLWDGEEVLDLRTNPLKPDTDDDLLTDFQEVRKHLTDPRVWDTDRDRLGDGNEVLKTLTDPLDTDTDDNGIPDAQEDPDGDLLTHDAETNTEGTDPLHPDTDRDDLTDGREVKNYGTNPLVADTDGDGLPDAVEVRLTGTDPTLVDSDGNGTPDPDEDPDGDGLVHSWEALLFGTAPTRFDSDLDLVGDGQEVADGTDPLDPLSFMSPAGRVEAGKPVRDVTDETSRKLSSTGALASAIDQEVRRTARDPVPPLYCESFVCVEETACGVAARALVDRTSYELDGGNRCDGQGRALSATAAATDTSTGETNAASVVWEMSGPDCVMGPKARIANGPWRDYTVRCPRPQPPPGVFPLAIPLPGEVPSVNPCLSTACVVAWETQRGKSDCEAQYYGDSYEGARNAEATAYTAILTATVTERCARETGMDTRARTLEAGAWLYDPVTKVTYGGSVEWEARDTGGVYEKDACSIRATLTAPGVLETSRDVGCPVYAEPPGLPRGLSP